MKILNTLLDIADQLYKLVWVWKYRPKTQYPNSSLDLQWLQNKQKMMAQREMQELKGIGLKLIHY